MATIPILGEHSYDLGPISFGAGALWVEDTRGVARVDPQTNTVVARIGDPSGGTFLIETFQIVATEDGVFIPHFFKDTVTRIDPATNAVVAKIRLAAGAAPAGIAATPGAIWVANHHGQSIARIDPTTNTVIATVPIGRMPSGACCGPSLLTVGAGSLWTGVPNIESVVRIDPHKNAVLATIPVGAGDCVGALAADDTAAWATSAGGCGAGGPVTRIDPSTNQTVPIPDQPALRPALQTTGAAIVGTNVYLALERPTPSLLRIDEATGNVTGYLALTGFPTSGDVQNTIVYGAGSLWVRGPGKVVRIQLTG